MKNILKIVGLGGFILLLSLGSSQTNAEPPTGFQRTLIIGSGLQYPTALEFAPDGRLFVLELGGGVRIYKDNALLPDPFATVPTTTAPDRSLLGIAFDPDFNTNHYVYFY